MTTDDASILVVDDDEFNARLLNRFLEKDGYQDVKVSGRREGLGVTIVVNC